MSSATLATDVQLRLIDLVPPFVLQSLLDDFLEDTEEPATIQDETGRDIVVHGQWKPFCKLLRGTEAGNQLCVRSDRKLICSAAESGRPLWDVCHAGLWNFCAPIRLHGKLLGYLIAGQFRGQFSDAQSSDSYTSYRSLQEECERISHTTGASAEPPASEQALRALFDAIPWYPNEKARELWQRFVKLHELIERVVAGASDNGLPRFQPLLDRMRDAPDLDSLTQCVLEMLPGFVHALSCSFFLVQWDPKDRDERLVLRATTWPPLRAKVGQLGYQPGEGLTGWVWKNRKPLRLSDIRDKEELARYPNLYWAHQSDDSAVYREWLGVPILDSRGRAIGVIRMSESERPGGFTLLDDIAAQAAAREFGRAVEDQMHSRTARVLEAIARLESRLLHISSVDELANTVLLATKQVFNLREARYFFHRLRESGKYWEIVHSIGELPLSPGHRTIFSIDEGLAGKAIRDQMTVIMTDPEDFQGNYLNVAESTQSAMVVPLVQHRRCIGALAVVASKKYAFLLQDVGSDGRGTNPANQAVLDDKGALELIAQLTAVALAQLRATEEAVRQRVNLFRAFAAGADHALRNWVTRLEDLVRERGWTDSTGRESLLTMRRLLAGMRQFILASDVQPSSMRLNDLLRELTRRETRDEVRIAAVRGGCFVNVDLERTVAAVGELINNGLDHGRPPVTVWVTTGEQLPGSDALYSCLHVRDSGVGVSPQIEHRIFDCGWTSRADHTGFGLFACRYVAQLQRGALDYIRDAEPGAHFRFFVEQFGDCDAD